MSDRGEADPSGSGRLLIVGTPIGNLSDLSDRARSALERSDVIACEDTRRCGRLLQSLGIGRRPMVVIEHHVERSGAERVIESLRSGAVVALVTDAGMPSVSDPGSLVVDAVAEAGFRIEVVPGPSALTAALSLSGYDGSRFVFEGFLARRGGARTADLTRIAGHRCPAVVYESPKRVMRTLVDMTGSCGPERRVVVCRELTKLHEEVWRGTLGDAVTSFEGRELKGEVVIVVDAAPAPPPVDDSVLAALLEREIGAGSSIRSAVDTVVAVTGARRRHVYDIATDGPPPAVEPPA